MCSQCGRPAERPPALWALERAAGLGGLCLLGHRAPLMLHRQQRTRAAYVAVNPVAVDLLPTRTTGSSGVIAPSTVTVPVRGTRNAERGTLIVDLRLFEASSPTAADLPSARLGSRLARLELRARTLHKESHRSRRAQVRTRKTSWGARSVVAVVAASPAVAESDRGVRPGCTGRPGRGEAPSSAMKVSTPCSKEPA